MLDGVDLRNEALEARRAKLQALLRKASVPRLRVSEEFADPIKLLAVSEQHGLEGTASKPRDQPYRSGKTAVGSRSRRPRRARRTRNDTSCLRTRREVASKNAAALAPHWPMDNVGQHDGRVRGRGGHQRHSTIHG